MGTRLEYVNERAVGLALEAGWSVVDLFSKTLPFAMDSADGVHCAYPSSFSLLAFIVAA